MTETEARTPLRLVAEARGYNIYRLAKLATVAPETVRGVWFGERWPSIPTLQKIAAVLEVDWQTIHPHAQFWAEGGISLRSLSEERGLTVEQLAERVDIALASLREIVLGQVSPEAASLQRIAEALGVDWRMIRIEYAEPSVPPMLQQAMEAKGLTVSLVAELTGLNYATVSDLLQGRRDLRSLHSATRRAIADVLGIDPRRPVSRLSVRELAEAQGFTISSLAERAGVSYPNMQRIWHGRQLPQEATRRKIAEVLGVDWQDL